MAIVGNKKFNLNLVNNDFRKFVKTFTKMTITRYKYVTRDIIDMCSETWGRYDAHCVIRYRRIT